MKHVKKTFTVHTVTSKDKEGKQHTIRCITEGIGKTLEMLGHTEITDTVTEMKLTMPISEFRKRASVMNCNKNNVVVRSLNCYEVTLLGKDGKSRSIISEAFNDAIKQLLEEAEYGVTYQHTVKKFYMRNEDFAAYCLAQLYPAVTEPEKANN